MLLFTLLNLALLSRANAPQESARVPRSSAAATLVRRAESEEQKLERLARRCASELDWAPSWSVAAERARDEGRLVLVYLRAYPGFQMSNDTLVTVFMDRDLEPLIQRRYVPFVYRKGMAAPFASPDAYGMSATTFGEALLLVSPDGEVRREIAASSLHASILDFLLAGLEEAPSMGLVDDEQVDDELVDSEPVGAAQATFEAGRECLLRGEHARAERVAELLSGWRAAWLKGSLLRRERRGEAALAAFDAALRDCDDCARGSLALERAQVLLGLDRVEAAVEALAPWLESGGALAAEAGVMTGLIQLSRAEREAARESWMGVVEQGEESRWAWMAAAFLRSTALEYAPAFSLAWPRESALRAQRQAAPEPWAPGREREARAGALEYLLASQSARGDWLCAADARGGEDRPRPLSLAVSAICTEALLPERGQARVEAALRAALPRLLASWRESQRQPAPSLFMDYSVWSDAYLLSCLGSCVLAGFGEADELRGAMAQVVADLARRQKSGGGWSYYLTSDLKSSADPYDISMSFTTAAILLGLWRAQEAEVALPEALLERALACLERMRNPNGTYTYMVSHADESLGRDLREGGAAGRGPACALALHLFGRCDLDELRLVLDMFARQRAGLAHERRKSLMHCGPEGQGSHYVFFDYMTAAAAIARLPAGERGEWRRMLTAEILAARNVDGSFVGNTMIGATFGTAAAALGLQWLH